MSEKTIHKKGGVKTKAGKAVSKYNAQTHMVLRDSATEYEGVEYKSIYEDLVDDLKPKGKMQEVLLEIISLNIIKLIRLGKSESELVKMFLSPYIESELPAVGFKSAHYQYEPKLDYSSEKLRLFARYQTATENRIYRAIGTLKLLQNEQS